MFSNVAKKLHILNGSYYGPLYKSLMFIFIITVSQLLVADMLVEIDQSFFIIDSSFNITNVLSQNHSESKHCLLLSSLAKLGTTSQYLSSCCNFTGHSKYVQSNCLFKYFLVNSLSDF